MDVDSLVDIAQQSLAELQSPCSYRYKSFTCSCEAQLDLSHGTGAWALQGFDDIVVLERFGIFPRTRLLPRKRQLFCV